jgi:LytS/YehU family sensor histidine kinase
LSKLSTGGHLSIDVGKNGHNVTARITNNGVGLANDRPERSNGRGVGLANVKNRLHLHYGEKCSFSIREIEPNRVEVSILFPFEASADSSESLTRYGV